MKKKSLIMFLAAGLAGGYVADDTFVTWNGTGMEPQDAAVSVTFDDEGAISSLTATPTEGSTVFLSGEAMTFAADAEISLLAPGKLVFSNDVSCAGTLKVGRDDPDAEISYSGDIIAKTPNETLLFPGKILADYDVKSSYFRQNNGGAGYGLLIGPSGLASAECVVRSADENGADEMRLLLQQWNGTYTYSVELKLVQRDEGIKGRVVSGRYTMKQNLVGMDIQSLYADGAILSNTVALVGWQNVADIPSNKKGYGVNQLTLVRNSPLYTVVFTGNSQAHSFQTSKGTLLTFRDADKSGAFTGSGVIDFESYGRESIYNGFLKNKTVVAYGRSLSDFLGASAFIGGKNAGSKNSSANAYFVEIDSDGNTGRCQMQFMNSTYVFCVFVKFEQDGANVVAYTDGGYMRSRNYDDVTHEVGIDFYDAPNWATYDSTGTNKVLYGRSITTTIDGSGLSLSDIKLWFSSKVFSLDKPNLMTDASRMNIKGCPESASIVQVTDLGGLPTNGLVTVGPYGVLDLNILNAPIHKDGVSGGNTEIVVHTNGVLRLSQRSVVSTYKQKFRLIGGDCELGHGLTQTATSDHHLYANTLMMSDGARMYGAQPRVGYMTYAPFWCITGMEPSISDSGAVLLAKGTNDVTETVFQLYVDDVTGNSDPDFIVNGKLRLYSATSYTNITIRKTGDGTLLQNGISTVLRETSLWRGAWVFGCSGVSEGAQEFRLEGGTTLGLADGVSNGLAKVVVKAPATLQMGEGSLLVLDDMELASGANLAIEGSFGKTSLLVTKALPSSVVSRISCPEGRVTQDKDGYIRPRIKTFSIIIR